MLLGKAEVNCTLLVRSEWVSERRSVVFDSLWPHGLYSPRNSPRQNTGVGSLSILQGNFPTQGLNPGLPQCRQILYQLNHKGSPRILDWVTYPFSSRSSQPRNRTRVSCIAGGFFTNWTIRLIECYGNFISTTIKQEENSKQIFSVSCLFWR